MMVPRLDAMAPRLWHSDSFFQELFLSQLSTSSHISGAQLGGVGGLPRPFLKIKKSTLILGKNALIAPFIGLSFTFKM